MARLQPGTNDTDVAVPEITNSTSAVGQTMLSMPGHWRDGVESTTYVVAIKTAIRDPRTRNNLLTSINLYFTKPPSTSDYA
jgi:hypothetical protein